MYGARSQSERRFIHHKETATIWTSFPLSVVIFQRNVLYMTWATCSPADCRSSWYEDILPINNLVQRLDVPKASNTYSYSLVRRRTHERIRHGCSAIHTATFLSQERREQMLYSSLATLVYSASPTALRRSGKRIQTQGEGKSCNFRNAWVAQDSLRCRECTNHNESDQCPSVPGVTRWTHFLRCHLWWYTN